VGASEANPDCATKDKKQKKETKKTTPTVYFEGEEVGNITLVFLGSP
jgi:hypothetical protein